MPRPWLIAVVSLGILGILGILGCEPPPRTPAPEPALPPPPTAVAPMETEILLAGAIRETRHEGDDDLLSAGLGLEGLRGAPPMPAERADPTAAELRRLAIHTIPSSRAAKASDSDRAVERQKGFNLDGLAARRPPPQSEVRAAVGRHARRASSDFAELGGHGGALRGGCGECGERVRYRTRPRAQIETQSNDTGGFSLDGVARRPSPNR